MAVHRAIELATTPRCRRVEPDPLMSDGGTSDGEAVVEGGVHNHDEWDRVQGTMKDRIAGWIGGRKTTRSGPSLQLSGFYNSKRWSFRQARSKMAGNIECLPLT